MQIENFFETLVNVYQTSRHHIQRNQIYGHENIKCNNNHLSEVCFTSFTLKTEVRSSQNVDIPLP
jgi:hypothetical protein